MKSQIVCTHFAFLLCCCGTNPREAVDPVPISDPHLASQDSRPKINVYPEVSALMREVAAVRGWGTGLSVDVELADHERLVAAMLADVRSQATPEELTAQANFLKAFGWLPWDFDFARDVTAHFAHELSGLYSFTWRRILVATHLDSMKFDAVLRHELVHAFQDSRYHIGTKVRWATDQGDYIAAIHALAEGEAICIERQLADSRQRGCLDIATDELDNANARYELRSFPPIIRESLIAPYADGVRLVRRLLREGGWPAVEQAWNGGLQSTRELLRGSSEQSSLLPVARSALPESFGACELLYTDILGEQSLRGVMPDTATPNDVERTLGSLTGERASLWRCTKFCVAAWHFRFLDSDSAMVVADWLYSSLGLSRPNAEGTGLCVSYFRGAATLVVRGHDIAITSVHACHDVPNRKVTGSCLESVRFANRLVAL